MLNLPAIAATPASSSRCEKDAVVYIDSYDMRRT